MNYYIDLTKFDIEYPTDYGTRISMAKMREALDLHESTSDIRGVHGFHVTESQYYAYERTIYDGMLLLGAVEGTPIPERLKFNGISLIIKK